MQDGHLACPVCGWSRLRRLDETRHECLRCRVCLGDDDGARLLPNDYVPISDRWAACSVTSPDAPPEEHAMDWDVTLCGIPEDRVCVWRHLWSPDWPDRRACPQCTAVAATVDTYWPTNTWGRP
jgi:hypothetical protein